MHAHTSDIKITFSDDPAWFLRSAGEFLTSQPTLHNLILTLLHARVAQREPGRYWVAMEGEKTVGVVLQSPLTFAASITPMEPGVVAAMVDAIADTGVALPGVNGEAATAASFAGQWTERCKSAATPFQGNRLYELLELGKPPDIAGKLRQAALKDRSLMIEWTHAFQTEIGEDASGTDLLVDRGWAAGQLWLWEQDETMSMVVSLETREMVGRVAARARPPARRRTGDAGACGP